MSEDAQSALEALPLPEQPSTSSAQLSVINDGSNRLATSIEDPSQIADEAEEVESATAVAPAGNATSGGESGVGAPGAPVSEPSCRPRAKEDRMTETFEAPLEGWQVGRMSWDDFQGVEDWQPTHTAEPRATATQADQPRASSGNNDDRKKKSDSISRPNPSTVAWQADNDTMAVPSGAQPDNVEAVTRPLPSSPMTNHDTSIPLSVVQPMFFHKAQKAVVMRHMMKSLKSISCLGPKYTNLQALLLSGNRLSDVSRLSACPRLRLLDLSFNLIRVLPGRDVFAQCKELQFLYLNDNELEWNAVVANTPAAPKLVALTLEHNPLAKHPRYRQLVVNRFNTLELLDNHCVADEEILEGADFGAEYGSCAPRTELNINDLRSREFECSDQKLLLILDWHLSIIRCRFLDASPSCKIQRFYRRMMFRKKKGAHWVACATMTQTQLHSLKKLHRCAVCVQQAVRRWLVFVRAWRDLDELLRIADGFSTQLGAYADDGLELAAAEAAVVTIQRQVRRWLAALHDRHTAAACITRAMKDWSLFIGALCAEALDLSLGPADRGLFVVSYKVPAVVEAMRTVGHPLPQPHVSATAFSAGSRRFFANASVYSIVAWRQWIHDGSSVGTWSGASGYLDLDVDLGLCRQRSPKPLASCLAYLQPPTGRGEHGPREGRSSLRSQGHSVSKADARALRSHVKVLARRKLADPLRFPLVWVEIGDRETLRHVVRALRIHDGVNSPVLTRSHTERGTAVLTLQAVWRGHAARRSQSLRTRVREGRACVCLQRWWKYRVGLHRRLVFVDDLFRQVRAIDSRVLFFEADVFFLLTQIDKQLTARVDERANTLGLGFDWGKGYAVRDSLSTPLYSSDFLILRRNQLRLPVGLETLMTELLAKNLQLESAAPSPRCSRDEDPDVAAAGIVALLTADVTAETVQSPIADPYKKLPPVVVAPTRRRHQTPNADDKAAVAAAAAASQRQGVDHLSPFVPRLWTDDHELLIGAETRFVRLEFSSVIEAQRRASLLMRNTYDATSGTHCVLYSFSMLSALSAAASRGLDPPFELPSRWMAQHRAFSSADRVRLELACQLLTQKVLSLPQAEAEEQRSVDARQGTGLRLSVPSQQQSVAVATSPALRPRSASTEQRSGTSRHGKLISHYRLRSTDLPQVPAPDTAIDTTARGSYIRQLEDLEMLLRVKLEHQRNEAELKEKQRKAAYTGPPKGLSTRLSPMQQVDVPRFVEECRQVQEQVKAQRWDEKVKLKELVRQRRGSEAEQKATSRLTRAQKVQKASTANAKYHTTQKLKLQEKERKATADNTELQAQRVHAEKRRQRAQAEQRSASSFGRAASMLSRYSAESTGRAISEARHERVATEVAARRKDQRAQSATRRSILAQQLANAKKQALLQRALEREKFRKPSVPVSPRLSTELEGGGETGAAEAAEAEATGDATGLIAELSSTEIPRRYGNAPVVSPRGFEATAAQGP